MPCAILLAHTSMCGFAGIMSMAIVIGITIGTAPASKAVRGVLLPEIKRQQPVI